MKNEDARVWAFTMIRDEADIIAYTLEHLIHEGVDGIVVSDNLSTDGSREQLLICAEEARKLGVPILIIPDENPGYYQSKKMSHLAEIARVASLEYHGNPNPWLIPFDADELFYSESGMKLGDHLRSIDPECLGIHVEMLNHFPTFLDEAPEDCDNPFLRIKYRHSEVNKLPKVIVQGFESGLIIEQGNHGAHSSQGSQIQFRQTGIKIRHFPYRSQDHFIRKAKNGAAAYAAAKDLPADFGAHWKMYGDALERGGEQALIDHFNRWFFFREDRIDEMILSPAPFRSRP